MTTKTDNRGNPLPASVSWDTEIGMSSHQKVTLRNLPGEKPDVMVFETKRNESNSGSTDRRDPHSVAELHDTYLNGEQISTEPTNWEEALFIAERKALELGLIDPRPEIVTIPFIGGQFIPLGQYWSAPLIYHGEYSEDLLAIGCRTLGEAETLAERWAKENACELGGPLLATQTTEWGYWLLPDVRLYAATDSGNWDDTYAVLENRSEHIKPGYGGAAEFCLLRDLIGREFGVLDPGDQVAWSQR